MLSEHFRRRLLHGTDIIGDSCDTQNDIEMPELIANDLSCCFVSALFDASSAATKGTMVTFPEYWEAKSVRFLEGFLAPAKMWTLVLLSRSSFVSARPKYESEMRP